MSRDPVASVIDFNRRFASRDPGSMARKVRKMADSPFGFFRATFHLFARDATERPPRLVPGAPELPIVGDLHTENFGVFHLGERLRYDVNDFDESTVGPFDLDPARLSASLFLAARSMRKPRPYAEDLVELFGRRYRKRLIDFSEGEDPREAGFDDRHPPDARPLRRLLREAQEADPREFVRDQTTFSKGRRRFRRTSVLFDLPKDERVRARALVDDYADRLEKPTDRDALAVEDVAGRRAGVGSLGRYRYAVLLRGEGSKDADNVVLELKEALPSAFDEARGRVIDVRDRAREVVRAMARVHVRVNRWTGTAADGAGSFQVRQLGARDRRIEWDRLKRTVDFGGLAETYADVLARAHALGDPRHRAADALERREESFLTRLASFALAAADRAVADWQAFVERRGEVERALGVEG